MTALIDYVLQPKPTFVIGGSPCGSLLALSQMNKIRYLEAYQKVRRRGEKCDSECFIELKEKHNTIGTISFPQCAVGLQNPEGNKPWLKW